MGLICRSSKPLLNTAPEQIISLSWHCCSKTGTYWVKIWDTSYLFEQSPTKFNATVLRGNYSEDCWTEKLTIIKSLSQETYCWGRHWCPWSHETQAPGRSKLWPSLLALIPALGRLLFLPEKPLHGRGLQWHIPEYFSRVKWRASCPQTHMVSKESRYQASLADEYSKINITGRDLPPVQQHSFKRGICRSGVAMGCLQIQSQDVLTVSCGFTEQVKEWILKILSSLCV